MLQHIFTCNRLNQHGARFLDRTLDFHSQKQSCSWFGLMHKRCSPKSCHAATHLHMQSIEPTWSSVFGSYAGFSQPKAKLQLVRADAQEMQSKKLPCCNTSSHAID